MSCGVGSRCGSDPCVAVAVASAYSSNLTPSVGASIGHGSSPRNGKKQKKSYLLFFKPVQVEALEYHPRGH